MEKRQMRLNELCRQAQSEQDAAKVKALMDQILRLLHEIQEEATKPKYDT
jgi:hypothetical protein